MRPFFYFFFRNKILQLIKIADFPLSCQSNILSWGDRDRSKLKHFESEIWKDHLNNFYNEMSLDLEPENNQYLFPSPFSSFIYYYLKFFTSGHLKSNIWKLNMNIELPMKIIKTFQQFESYLNSTKILTRNKMKPKTIIKFFSSFQFWFQCIIHAELENTWEKVFKWFKN